MASEQHETAQKRADLLSSRRDCSRASRVGSAAAGKRGGRYGSLRERGGYPVEGSTGFQGAPVTNSSGSPVHKGNPSLAAVAAAKESAYDIR